MSRLNPSSQRVPRGAGTHDAPTGRHAVVVGGGIAGIAAAVVLAERGVRVTLLERDAQLGGRAAGFAEQLATGETVEMERGFHAFFRQYYNLRSLLRRVDPALSMLTALEDYPILGPEGRLQSFRGLPTRTPFRVMSLVAHTPYLKATDLLRVNGRAALEMLRFDAQRTYARFDGVSAREYLDSLGFPETARRMLFDVFSHSFFNPEEELSAADLLMMFHFYFTGNPDGLVFDVANRPMSTALWQPFARWLERHGAALELSCAVEQIQRRPGGGYRVSHARGELDADLAVLALDVPGLQRVVASSPDLAPLLPSVGSLCVTRPFAVWRRWLDRPVRPERAAFAGTTGVGLLDNISIYERFQDESAHWSRSHGGSVVELHAYAVPPGLDEPSIKRDLLQGLHAFYPETRAARALDERFLLRQDCPGFPVGGHTARPRVATPFADLALAGDGIAVPVPCALMERAAVSGFMAASTVLAPLGVRSESIRSVPTHGLLARPQRARAQQTQEVPA
jgi:isorenieratene synthase